MPFCIHTMRNQALILLNFLSVIHHHLALKIAVTPLIIFHSGIIRTLTLQNNAVTGEDVYKSGTQQIKLPALFTASPGDWVKVQLCCAFRKLIIKIDNKLLPNLLKQFFLFLRLYNIFVSGNRDWLPLFKQ